MQWMKSLFVWVILLGFMVLAFNLFEGNREHCTSSLKPFLYLLVKRMRNTFKMKFFEKIKGF